MRTLNDYIKESILDDEDVLMNKAEEDSKNPFIVIGNLIVASPHLAKDTSTQQAIDKIIRNKLVEHLPDIFKTSSWASKKGLVINYYGSTVSIKWGSDSNVEFLTIRGGYQDYKAVVYLLDSYHMEQVKSFGFKNKTQYEKWVKEFMKKFDLTPAPHDMFIGTI